MHAESAPKRLRIRKAVWTGLVIFCKGILALVITVALWVVLTPYFRLDRTYDGDYFRNLPEHTVDVIALGSSHIQYAFNPANFFAETGYYSYVLGSSCQPFSESYYMLKEALKTQHPSVVLLDVFTLLPQSQVCYADGTYYLAMDMMSEPVRTEAAGGLPKDIDFDTKLSYTLDLYMNHGNWKRMNFADPQSILNTALAKEGYSWDMGYVREQPTILQYTPLTTFAVTETVTLSEEEKLWIDRIADLCRENEIHLLYLKTPYLENQEDANKLDAIWKYLDEKGYPYIDFIARAAELEWFMDMDGDTWHNNTWGAEIVTRHLAEVLKNNGWLKEHKEEEMMELLMKTGMQKSARDLLSKSNINIYRLMEEGAKYPCTILFRYKGNEEKSSIGEYENQALNDLGLHHDFLNHKEEDYYAVVKDGELLKDGNEPFEMTLSDHKITLSEDDIKVENASVGTPGELQIVFLDDEFSWINPLGIDYSSRWFWKNGCDGWNCG